MTSANAPVHVSLLALPEAMASTLGGIYDVLNSLDAVASFTGATPGETRFAVEIVGERAEPMQLASGIPFPVQRPVSDVRHTDIVIVPSLLVSGGDWQRGRYGALVDWLAEMHCQGAKLCSACSGIFLLAETGLFDGHDATVHWMYASSFRRVYPNVPVHPEKVLVSAGPRGELISCGASTSWHDLVLYLIAMQAGATAAQAVTKFFALQSHQDGLAPYVVFNAPRDHGDAIVADVQDWLRTHYSVASPIDEMVRRTGLPERTFKRRFTQATGHSPLAYVQRVRVEEAKRRLERTQAPIDEISWQVGYEDPAFFRRLFQRVTQLSPGAYRRRFSMPTSS